MKNPKCFRYSPIARTISFSALALGMVLFDTHLLRADDPLPEGDTGLAARYPDDQGIADDDAVLFADDFEKHKDKADLSRAWSSVYNRVRLTQESKNVCAGKQAIEFEVPEKRTMASQATVYLDKPQDLLFLRYCSKFDPDYDVRGVAHNGGGIAANVFRKDGSNSVGVKPDGSDHFYATIDHGRLKGLGEVANPGYLGIYLYHPAQRHQWGDGLFPTGMVIPNSSQKFDFGPEFKPRPNQVTPLGTWHCHELMLRANTPGKTDGRVTAWVDGKIVMDFPNLRLRDVASLKMDYFQIGLYLQKGEHATTRKWYDNIVLATSYIGPVKSGADTPRDRQ